MSVEKKNSEFCLTDIANKETLELLEWRRLCEQIASFASTPQGKRKCLTSEFPIDIEASRRSLAETLEIGILDSILEGGISFFGWFISNSGFIIAIYIFYILYFVT